MKVSVVGSGVVGLTIAYRLAKEGIQVTVFEQDELATKSSWAGAGILPPSNDSDPVHPLEHLQSLSNQLHPKLSRELLDLTGIDNEFRLCGGIYIARTAGEAAALIGNSTLWEKQLVPFEFLNQSQVADVEPSFSTSVVEQIRTAVLVPGESQLRNPCHLKALLSACNHYNVEFRSFTRVRDVQQSNENAVVLLDGEEVTSDFVCVATGAWTSKLTSSISKVQIIPVKGHMLLYKMQKPIFHRVINEANRYVVCRQDGHVLVGSSEEESGFDESTSEAEIARLKQFAASLAPELMDDHLIRTWTGLRPMAYDHLPYIGSHSKYPRILFATGHFRSGLHLSTGTAEVIGNMILGKSNEFDLSALRPER